VKKKVKLKDGTEVLIRTMKKDDAERSLNFFLTLPEEDRAYLREAIKDLSAAKQRIRGKGLGKIRRLVAVLDDQIIGDGTLEFEAREWATHIAEIRLLVGRPYQRRGLGSLMARELFLLAARKKVEEIIVKMMGPQLGVQAIFEHLGFHRVAEYRDFVKDISGKKQDLIVMRCPLEELWQKLEEHMAGADWQRTR
jgi:L-amino acid N-acyltransferase YncA